MNADASYRLLMGAFGRAVPAKHVFVEGNVGAGKTSLIEEMKRCLIAKGKTVYVFTEDVERWTHQRLLGAVRDGNEAGERAFHALGPLRDFIDRQRFVNEYDTRYDYVIFERHPRTTLYVFGAVRDDATRELFETVHTAYPFMTDPRTTVFVRVSSKECYARVCRRARDAERDMNVFYIQHLEKKHDLEMRARIDSGLEVIDVSGERATPREIAETVCARL